MSIEPGKWLEYGPLGAGILLLFLNMTFFAWMVGKFFNIVTSQVLPVLHDAKEAVKGTERVVEKMGGKRDVQVEPLARDVFPRSRNKQGDAGVRGSDRAEADID